MEYRNFLERLIISAGILSLQFRKDLGNLDVSSKNGTVRDLVSEADESIESFIRRQIEQHFPEHKVIGEELGASRPGPKDFCWVVDPIDGTVNFVKGFVYYSVSIALQQNGQTLCGAVYGPAMGQLYIAERGAGAFGYRVQLPETVLQADSLDLQNLSDDYSLEGKQRLKVRPLEQLSEAVLVTGFACVRAGIQPNNYLYLGYVLPRVSDVRRLGSAALDISAVAAGVFDGFWEIGLSLYDLAAACLILEEAGGHYSDLYGNMEDYPCSVLAAGPGLHGRLVDLLAEVDKPYNGFRSLLQQAKNAE
ncbi:inositol monophosphatase family protein [Candidatus Haliotispira prima]|uniref:Inositol-1-monophosphatase n=1 Tax=Candidatus Haliotispira prima TaxID=3034016 RepID=A0ABY8MLL6_9SPIO|nr:inositol monophosphatase family protein [Candidatus Haliotispira prima]